MALGIEHGRAFVGLMRRYVVDYTNRHDLSVTAELMESDYTLRMGEHVVRGRDDQYRAATAKQLAQFPGLGLTVHRLATSGERLVMHFSEHGASRLHGGRISAWGGIGLYRWNGRKLTHNAVEQDYFSRRTQLATGSDLPVAAPAIAPWDTVAEAPDPVAERVARQWLANGALAYTPGVICDDGGSENPSAPLIEQTGIAINDLFSCGGTVAFHVTQRGHFLPGDGIVGPAGANVFLDIAGYVDVVNGALRSGHVIRNRLDLMRRFGARAVA